MRPRTRAIALEPLAHSKPDAAVRAGVGLSAIKEAVKNGELAEVEKGGRRLILDEDLHQWLLRDRVIHNGNGHHTGEKPNGTRPPAAPEEAPNNPPRRRGRPPRATARPPP